MVMTIIRSVIYILYYVVINIDIFFYICFG